MLPEQSSYKDFCDEFQQCHQKFPIDEGNCCALIDFGFDSKAQTDFRALLLSLTPSPHYERLTARLC